MFSKFCCLSNVYFPIHLPLINDIEELIDEGITRGLVNWQLYGSRKPNQGAYLIKYHYELCWQQNEQEWRITEMDMEKFNTQKNLHKLWPYHFF